MTDPHLLWTLALVSQAAALWLLVDAGRMLIAITLGFITYFADTDDDDEAPA